MISDLRRVVVSALGLAHHLRCSDLSLVTVNCAAVPATCAAAEVWAVAKAGWKKSLCRSVVAYKKDVFPTKKIFFVEVGHRLFVGMQYQWMISKKVPF